MGKEFDNEFFEFSRDHEKRTTAKFWGIKAAQWARDHTRAKLVPELSAYREFISHIYQTSENLKHIAMAEELLSRFR